MKTTRKGFTLIELLVVIALIAMVSMIVAPEVLNSLEQRDLENSARDILSILERAKNLSVRSKLNHRVRFDNPTGVWQLQLEMETSPGTWQAVTGYVTRTIPGKFNVFINLPPADMSVEFSPLGFVNNFDTNNNTVVMQSERLRLRNRPDRSEVMFFAGGSVKYFLSSTS